MNLLMEVADCDAEIFQPDKDACRGTAQHAIHTITMFGPFNRGFGALLED
jgi:hypothetical protein